MNKPRILVVDDNEDVRHVLRCLLEPMGCEILEAGSAEEALEVLSETTPDVAMLDIVLPGKSGLEVTREIRLLDSAVPIIVVATEPDRRRAPDAADVQVSDYLVKPFTAETLRENLEKHGC